MPNCTHHEHRPRTSYEITQPRLRTPTPHTHTHTHTSVPHQGHHRDVHTQPTQHTAQDPHTRPRSPHSAPETTQPQPRPQVAKIPTPSSRTPPQDRHRGTGYARPQQHPPTLTLPCRGPDPGAGRAAELHPAPCRSPPLSLSLLHPGTGEAAVLRQRGRPHSPPTATRSRSGFSALGRWYRRHRDRADTVRAGTVSGLAPCQGCGSCSSRIRTAGFTQRKT